jgi:hypothetical protein
VLGELPEQADGRLLVGVVAGEQSEDDDLLVALGAEAGGAALHHADDPAYSSSSWISWSAASMVVSASSRSLAMPMPGSPDRA